MTGKPALLFLFSTSQGIPVLIHPFGEEKQIRSEGSIKGYYGSNPEVEAMAIVRNLLYARIDREIQEWVSEKQFLPRFAASLVVFFLFFFFMAWVIRDVIPLIDELLVSTFAAVTTYLVIGRRGQVSKPALEQKIGLKKRVDAIQFTQSKFIVDFEKVFRLINDAGGAPADISAGYAELLEQLSDDDCLKELEQLNNTFAILPGRKRRIRKIISRGSFPKQKKPEEQLYALTQALLMKIYRPDSVQTS